MMARPLLVRGRASGTGVIRGRRAAIQAPPEVPPGGGGVACAAAGADAEAAASASDPAASASARDDIPDSLVLVGREGGGRRRW